MIPVLSLAPSRASFEREALVHLDDLYRVALRLAGNRHDADDLVQDTMLKAYRAWDQFRPGSNAKAWLLTILRNAFVNEYRRRAARRETVELDAVESLAGADDPALDGVVGDEVLRAIAALPIAYREVLVLTDVEDLRYEDTARVLGVPVGTVKSRLSRARRILKAKLRSYAAADGWTTTASRR